MFNGVFRKSPQQNSKKYGNLLKWFSILIFLCLLVLIPTIILYYFAHLLESAKLIPLLLGIPLVLLGYIHLVYILPWMAKDVETRLSMEALRASFWLVIFGLILILFGVLFLMGILPSFEPNS
jgi:hypothetical protein